MGRKVRAVQKEEGRAKEATATPVCRFFLTDGGCKKGADCTYKHEFDGDKRGRCWNCGGTSHTRKDCPMKVRKPPDGDGGAKNFSENDVKGQAVKKVVVDASAPTTGGGEGSAGDDGLIAHCGLSHGQGRC